MLLASSPNGPKDLEDAAVSLLTRMILAELDGRKAHQWVTSTLGYLNWRSGAEWRPLSDRWNPDRIDYLRAAYLVKSAQNVPDRALQPWAGPGADAGFSSAFPRYPKAGAATPSADRCCQVSKERPTEPFPALLARRRERTEAAEREPDKRRQRGGLDSHLRVSDGPPSIFQPERAGATRPAHAEEVAENRQSTRKGPARVSAGPRRFRGMA
jgi:hypothetical protein